MKRLALSSLALVAPVILVLSFVGGGAAGEALFALLVTAFPVLLIALAAPRRGFPPGFTLPLLALLVLLEGGVLGMLLLRGSEDAGRFGGMPATLALLVYGVFLAPLILVSLAYGLGFDRFGLRQESLDRLRRLRSGSPRPERPEGD